MKLAIPLNAGRLSAHFGHCEHFALIEAEAATGRIITQEAVVSPPHEPGVLPQWLHQQGVEAVIAGGMGRRALELFARNGIAVHAGRVGGTPESLVKELVNGTLGGGIPDCGHDHGGGHCHNGLGND